MVFLSELQIHVVEGACGETGLKLLD